MNKTTQPRQGNHTGESLTSWLPPSLSSPLLSTILPSPLFALSHSPGPSTFCCPAAGPSRLIAESLEELSPPWEAFWSRAGMHGRNSKRRTWRAEEGRLRRPLRSRNYGFNGFADRVAVNSASLDVGRFIIKINGSIGAFCRGSVKTWCLLP